MAENHYKPLPDGLFIEESNIDGQGLFTDKFIHRNTDLGVCHIEMRTYDMDSIIIRTPLGGFINHSDDPNCIKLMKDNKYYMMTCKDIKAGEELFLKYTFYTI